MVQPRRPHKEGCLCVVCKNKRAKAARESIVEEAPIAPVIVEPPEVELNTLPTASLFLLRGERYRMATKEPDCIVCHRLSFRSEGPLETDKFWLVIGQVSLGISTMVKPIK